MHANIPGRTRGSSHVGGIYDTREEKACCFHSYSSIFVAVKFVVCLTSKLHEGLRNKSPKGWSSV